MKSKIVNKYHWKIKLRQWKTLFKNYSTTFIAFGIIGVYILYQSINMYLANMSLIFSNRNGIYIFFSAMVFIVSLVRNKFPFMLHPADMIYFSLEDFKKYKIKNSILTKGAVYAIASTVFTLTVFGVGFDGVLVALLLWTVLMASLQYRYLRISVEKDYKVTIIYIILNTLLITSLYFGNNFKIVSLITGLFIDYVLYKFIMSKRIIFDSVYDAIYETNMIQYAARNQIIADMSQIVKERSAEKHRSISFNSSLNRSNAILQKGLLSIRRTDTKTMGMLFGILIFVIILYSSGLLGKWKFISELQLDKMIVVMLVSIFLVNLLKVISDQYRLLLTKEKGGLFLPYTSSEIRFNYYKIAIPTLSAFSVLITVLLKFSLFKIIIALLSVNVLTLVCFYLLDKMKNLNRLFSIINVSIIFLMLILMNI